MNHKLDTKYKLKRFASRRELLFVIGSCWLALVIGQSAGAITKIPDPPPQPGSYGLEAKKVQKPPTQGATITTPNNGASFTKSPIDVRGICPTGLLVEILNNGVLAGSTMCDKGSYSLKISLFSGINALQAMVYDSVGQSGPASKIVKITYNNTHFTSFGQGITLTSDYGRRSAAVGHNLRWPLKLSGGTGPYAFSIDWGDGSSDELKSQSVAGLVNIDHVYKRAGFFPVSVRVTDSKGVSAFLQLVAVSNGKTDTTAATTNDDHNPPETIVRVIWIPAVIALALLLPTYWLGRRSELVSLRHQMQKERDDYGE